MTIAMYMGFSHTEVRTDHKKPSTLYAARETGLSRPSPRRRPESTPKSVKGQVGQNVPSEQSI